MILTILVGSHEKFVMGIRTEICNVDRYYLFAEYNKIYKSVHMAESKKAISSSVNPKEKSSLPGILLVSLTFIFAV